MSDSGYQWLKLKQFCLGVVVLVYMVPDSFVFHDALPKTSTGKIDYQALKNKNVYAGRTSLRLRPDGINRCQYLDTRLLIGERDGLFVDGRRTRTQEEHRRFRKARVERWPVRTRGTLGI